MENLCCCSKTKTSPYTGGVRMHFFQITFWWDGFQSFLDLNDSKLLLVFDVEHQSCSFPTSMKISTRVIVRRTRKLCYLLHYINIKLNRVAFEIQESSSMSVDFINSFPDRKLSLVFASFYTTTILVTTLIPQ